MRYRSLVFTRSELGIPAVLACVNGDCLFTGSLCPVVSGNHPLNNIDATVDSVSTSKDCYEFGMDEDPNAAFPEFSLDAPVAPCCPFRSGEDRLLIGTSPPFHPATRIYI